jgi:SAM-dependent methyltransferase
MMPEPGSVEWLLALWGWDTDTEAIYDVECPGETPSSFYSHTETILGLLQPRPDEDGVTIGCGCGRVEAQWAARVRSIQAVDFAGAAVRRGNALGLPNVRFHTNDGRSLPLPDASFDWAMCETTFQHVPADIALGYIREVHRVLRPAGRFACQIPRWDVYGDTPKCGGMTREQVGKALSQFHTVFFPSDAVKQDYYHVPVAIK